MEHKDMHAAMCGDGHWTHIAIKIFVALFIFWCGVQFGELKGMIRAGYVQTGGGYGSPTMMNWRQ